LRLDIDATMATLTAFNRWLEDDWGFGRDGRVIGVPMLSLADPAAAVSEATSLIERGARIVHVRPAPVPGAGGRSRSLGDPAHDRVWAVLAEASVPVAFHLGDSGYNRFSSMWGGPEVYEPFFNDVLSKLLVSDRAIHDTMGSLIVHGVFHRHPGLRVASIENGSDWLHVLAKRLRKLANQSPSAFAEDPLETVRRHIWVTPYYEEDMHALADLVGVDHILFGSDWPHGEGLAEPLSFAKELDEFDDAAVARIMRDNLRELIAL
jgi:predicted TIM-barrel fold metal-dependent hydrolase